MKKEYLLKNEEIKYEAKLHWSAFVGPAGILFIAISAWVSVSPFAGPPLFIIGISWLLRTFIKYISNEYVVTNQRVILKEGLLFRNTVETNISKIEAAGIQQTLFDKIFGSGSVVISGSGGLKQVFLNIDKPIEFRRHIGC